MVNNPIEVSGSLDSKSEISGEIRSKNDLTGSLTVMKEETGIDKALRWFQGITVIAAIGAVCVSVFALLESSRLNNATMIFQSDSSTQIASYNITQIAQNEKFSSIEAANTERGIQIQETEIALLERQIEAKENETSLRSTEIALSQSTILPGISEFEATATSIAISRGLALSETERTIYSFYLNLNNDQYGDAWTLLTPRYQDASNNNSFLNFKDFWEIINTVNIIEVSFENIDDALTEAKYLVTIEYVQDTARWQKSYRYVLEFDDKNNRWLIDQLIVPE